LEFLGTKTFMKGKKKLQTVNLELI